MATHTARLEIVQPEQAARRLEGAARVAFDSEIGRSTTDGEWGRARARWLELVAILRGWEQRARLANSGVGKVEVLCQREP